MIGPNSIASSRFEQKLLSQWAKQLHACFFFVGDAHFGYILIGLYIYETMKIESLLKTYIHCLLAEDGSGEGLHKGKRRRSRRRAKPGGGLTDLGALRRVNEREFIAKIRSALSSTDGDVEVSAKQLGVAASTLYLYLEEYPELQSARKVVDEPGEK